MALYDWVMVTRTALPDEAVDMTTSELHELVLSRLVDVLRYLFGDTALVLSDIFVRVDEADQVYPDVLIVPSARPGARTVYRIPPEPVPAVTVEVLSSANYKADGRAELEHKRALLGRIGVATHVEIDPERGFITTWRNTGTELVVGPPSDSYEGPALGGLRIEAVEPGNVRLVLPDGREFVDARAEMARADAEAARADAEKARADAQAARADAEAARADAEAERAERLSEALRRAGLDPGSV